MVHLDAEQVFHQAGRLPGAVGASPRWDEGAVGLVVAESIVDDRSVPHADDAVGHSPTSSE